VLLVAVALIAYERAVAPGSMPMVDDSRSAAVFARLQAGLEDSMPEDAANWIVLRYEELVAVCAEPT
jgi:membrane protein required for colicin V production